MINIFISGKNTGWIGYGYCLKKEEYIEFERVIEGYNYDFSLTQIGISVRNAHG